MMLSPDLFVAGVVEEGRIAIFLVNWSDSLSLRIEVATRYLMGAFVLLSTLLKHSKSGSRLSSGASSIFVKIALRALSLSKSG